MPDWQLLRSFACKFRLKRQLLARLAIFQLDKLPIWPHSLGKKACCDEPRRAARGEPRASLCTVLDGEPVLLAAGGGAVTVPALACRWTDVAGVLALVAAELATIYWWTCARRVFASILCYIFELRVHDLSPFLSWSAAPGAILCPAGCSCA